MTLAYLRPDGRLCGNSHDLQECGWREGQTDATDANQTSKVTAAIAKRQKRNAIFSVHEEDTVALREEGETNMETTTMKIQMGSKVIKSSCAALCNRLGLMVLCQ